MKCPHCNVSLSITEGKDWELFECPLCTYKIAKDKDGYYLNYGRRDFDEPEEEKI